MELAKYAARYPDFVTRPAEIQALSERYFGEPLFAKPLAASVAEPGDRVIQGFGNSKLPTGQFPDIHYGLSWRRSSGHLGNQEVLSGLDVTIPRRARWQNGCTLRDQSYYEVVQQIEAWCHCSVPSGRPISDKLFVLRRLPGNICLTMSIASFGEGTTLFTGGQTVLTLPVSQFNIHRTQCVDAQKVPGQPDGAVDASKMPGPGPLADGSYVDGRGGVLVIDPEIPKRAKMLADALRNAPQPLPPLPDTLGAPWDYEHDPRFHVGANGRLDFAPVKAVYPPFELSRKKLRLPVPLPVHGTVRVLDNILGGSGEIQSFDADADTITFYRLPGPPPVCPKRTDPHVITIGEHYYYCVERATPESPSAISISPIRHNEIVQAINLAWYPDRLHPSSGHFGTDLIQSVYLLDGDKVRVILGIGSPVACAIGPDFECPRPLLPRSP